MKNLFCVSILVFLLVSLSAQETSQDSIVVKEDSLQPLELYKNSLMLTVGTIVMAGAVTGSYERMLLVRQESPFRALSAKVGVGRLSGWTFGDFRYTIFLLSLGLMVGGESSFFEIGFGGVYMDGWHEPDYLFFGKGDRQYESYTYPSGSLGYRYQKPGGKFVFRGGAAYPEALYISLGVCF